MELYKTVKNEDIVTHRYLIKLSATRDITVFKQNKRQGNNRRGVVYSHSV